MTICSLTAYAKRHGVSKQAATKWKTRGVLVFSGDLVDEKASDRRMRDAGLGLYKRPSTTVPEVDRRPPKVDTKPSGVDRTAAPAPALEDGEIDPGGIEQFLADLNIGKYRSQVDAQKIKENVLAARHLMSLQKEAGELIEVERASTQFFKLARDARDAWITWPARIGPLLAADLKADTPTVVEALNRYVQEQLERIGAAEPDFDEEE